MERITVSVSEQEQEVIKKKVQDGGEYESKSEFVRNCIRDHTRLEDLERELERAQNEKRLLIEDRREKKELARYVEQERTYRNAGLRTRAKWWLFGKPSEA